MWLMLASNLEIAPRPEDIASSVHLTRADVVSNWETRSGIKGFLDKLLVDQAHQFWDSLDFQAFEDILALLIYGLVLFPNSDSFVDVNAMKIFMSRNPVPTLLGDILHALYARTARKRGTLMCCATLLARWFISHLPKSVLKNEEGMGWAYRIMSLAHTDIIWSTKDMEEVDVIDRCGEYTNVPLLGIRGGITYNPCLALQQFGRARRDGPHELLLPDIVFYFIGDVEGHRGRFIRAWDRVNRSDPHELGMKTSLPMQPYLQWVRARAQKLGMPYEAVLPVIVEHTDEEGVSYTVLHPHMPTDIGALKRSWIQLREERDTYREKYHEQERKILKLTRLTTMSAPKENDHGSTDAFYCF